MWIWAALTQATAIVLLTTTRALGSLNSHRDDAARLAGASSTRIWWFLTWPAIRCSVAPVVNLIFLLTLADPGPPLILGLRRSIGFQIVFLANRPDPFPRIAGLCLIVLMITVTWRRLVHWWGRVGPDPGLGMVGAQKLARPSAREVGWARTLMYGLVLLPAAILAWLPMVGLTRMSLAYASSTSASYPPTGGAVLDEIHGLTEEPVPTLLVHSALLGLGVALLLAALASWRPHGSFALSARRWRKIGALLSSSVPPLVVGVGVLSLSRMATLVSLWLDTRLEWSGAALVTGLVARALDPYGAPGLALYLGVCLAHLPSKLLARFTPAGRDDPVTHRTDQALLSGAGSHRARRLGLRGPDTIPSRSILLTSVQAAIGIAPAILLAPTMDSRSIGPGIVILASGPENARSQAALLALAIIVIALGALGWQWMRSFAGARATGFAGPAGEELV
jgi:iron(III) transport system permease protein